MFGGGVAAGASGKSTPNIFLNLTIIEHDIVVFRYPVLHHTAQNIVGLGLAGIVDGDVVIGNQRRVERVSGVGRVKVIRPTGIARWHQDRLRVQMAGGGGIGVAVVNIGRHGGREAADGDSAKNELSRKTGRRACRPNAAGDFG